MKFNLNKLILSTSQALDKIENEIFGISTYHSKRISYISLFIAKELNLSEDEIFDVAIYALLHDIGLSAAFFQLGSKEKVDIKFLERISLHCTIGEEYLYHMPFVGDHENIVKYHHEHYDGSGIFGLKGDQIPFMAQIINLADTIDMHFDLYNNISIQKDIIKFVENNPLFNPIISEAFIKLANSKIHFWIDLQNSNIDKAINRYMPIKIIETSYDEILKYTQIISKVTDTKSSVTRNHSTCVESISKRMAQFYKFDLEKLNKFSIASTLHDIGKLAIPNSILEKESGLSDRERTIMNEHIYYTYIFLEDIDHFDDIRRWASQHHEKLDGSGYPFGLKADEIDFESRLLACIDIYQALREVRSYKDAFSHEKAISILKDEAQKGLIDSEIVKDIDIVLKNYQK